jgi:hypothetical protein
MNTKRNILFSWLLLIGFLIPISINFVHNFEKHQHTVCDAKDVKHFHQLEKDCSVFHYVIHGFVFNLFSYKLKFSTKIISEVLYYKTINYAVNLPYKTSRAPPFL